MKKIISITLITIFVAFLSACDLIDGGISEVPGITLTGGTEEIEVGGTFEEPTCEITGSLSEEYECTVSGEVNIDVPGEYDLVFSVTDSSGTVLVDKTFTVTVTEPGVVDIEVPVITLTGGVTELLVGEAFVEPTCTVTDNIDTDLECTVTGEVNTEVEGTYVLTYSVSDASGNTAIEQTFTVIVEKPVELNYYYYDLMMELDEYSPDNEDDIIAFINLLNDNDFLEFFFAAMGEGEEIEEYQVPEEEMNLLMELFEGYVNALLDDISFYMLDLMYIEDDFCYLDDSKEVLLKYIGTDMYVDIPEGIKIIGVGAFSYTDVETVTIPSTVTTISLGAFAETMLTQVTIPENVESIGYYSFMDTNLDFVIIEGDKTRFDSIWEMTGFDLSLHPTYLVEGDYEFMGATNKIIFYHGRGGEVVIPSEIGGYPVYEIADFAFSSSSITKITIPETVERLGYRTFDKYSLEEVVILGDESRFYTNWEEAGLPIELATFIITTEDGFMFDTHTGTIMAYTSSIQNVVIPEEIEGVTVRNIARESFSNRGIISVTIPETIEEIDRYSFYGNAIEEITILGDSTRFDTIWEEIGFPIELATFIITTEDGYTFDTSKGSILKYTGSATVLTIPSEIEGVVVESIGSGAFEKNRVLTSVTIPDSVIRIGERAFASSKGTLTEVYLGSNVEEIGYEAFKGHGIVSLTIPASVMSIQYQAFQPTNDLGNTFETITILGDASRFDYRWSSLGFPLDLASFIVTTEDGYVFNSSTGAIIDYVGETSVLVIPSEIAGVAVTGIGDSAFSYSSTITDVTIPDSVIVIGNYAFRNAMGTITSLHLGSSVKYIHYQAFSGHSLTELTIPESVEMIDYLAFQPWDNLEETLQSITILGDENRFNSSWSNIGFPRHLNPSLVTTEDGYVFNSEMGSIVDYNGTATDLVLPSVIEGVAVSSIETLAFNAIELNSLTIPESIYSIHYDAFHQSKIGSITILGDENRFNDLWLYIGFPAALSPYMITTEDGIVFDSENEEIVGFVGTGSVLVIPSEIDGVVVSVIQESAFEGNSTLLSVTIPDTVELILPRAFANTALTDITFGENVYYVGEEAFLNHHFTSLIIPANLDNISHNAFYQENVSTLTRVIVLGHSYRLNQEWEYIGFPLSTMPDFIETEDGFVFDIVNQTISDYTGHGGEVVIPSTIEGVQVYGILDNSFSYANLTSITIPESVMFIESGAFRGNNLEAITILGDGNRFDDVWLDVGFPVELSSFVVTSADGFVFNTLNGSIINYVGSQTDIVIPSAINDNVVLEISAYAFSGKGLTSVTIPETVVIIGTHAFGGNDITSVTLLGDETRFDDVWFEVGLPLDPTKIEITDVDLSTGANVVILGAIDVDGENDFYMIELTETTNVTIYTLVEDGDSFGYLYDSSFQLLGENDDYSDLNFKLIHTLDPGVYYIQVRAFSPYATFEYELHIDIESD